MDADTLIATLVYVVLGGVLLIIGYLVGKNEGYKEAAKKYEDMRLREMLTGLHGKKGGEK